MTLQYDVVQEENRCSEFFPTIFESADLCWVYRLLFSIRLFWLSACTLGIEHFQRSISRGTIPSLSSMNWDSERDMARDVKENEDLYEAFAATPDDEDER